MPPSLFCRHLTEYLAPLGVVTTRSMFGGHGVSCDGVMFGLVADDTLYLKADPLNRPQFEAAGLEPFQYDGKGGKPIAMSYWRAPDDFFDDQSTALAWARGALEAARRAKAATPASRARSNGAARRRGRW